MIKLFLIFYILIITLSTYAAIEYKVLVKRNDIIWGMDFLAPNKIIFTEREGVLAVLNTDTNAVTKVDGLPKIYASGQGGLLDVKVHKASKAIYITYSSEATGGSALVLARASLQDNKLVDFKEIFKTEASRNDYHFGSRIEFGPDDSLFITSGERGERPRVQQQNSYFGKIIRMKLDGTSPEIWSTGHRSPQGLAMRPNTSELWEAEMGPKGGDEINLIIQGENYGWPLVTRGTEYSGQRIGVSSRDGYLNPQEFWVPSISPSAMVFWNDQLYLATLSGEHIRQVSLKKNKVTEQKELLKDLGWRFRALRVGPDNLLYFTTDEGRIGKILSL